MARSVRAFALAVAVLLAVPDPAGAADGTEDAAAYGAEDLAAEQRLAEAYAPVMMLVRQDESCGPGEPYVPSDVDALFDEPSIALRGPWTDRDLVAVAPSVEELAEGLEGYALDQPGDPLEPGCDYEDWADSVWGSSPEPTIYAHVATEAGVEDRIALQYFFYYPFNDYNNKHESDWERIQVEFPAGDAATALETGPDLVLYAQHYGAERADWDDDKLELDGTHPVVYVSAGSHASQFDEGLYLGRSATEGFGCDTTIGPHDEVRPEVRTIPSDLEAAAEAYPWTTYRGHWGDVGPRRFYEGPTGPNMKQAWRKPFTWSAKAREHSFSLPGAEVAGDKAGAYFCTLVGSGSDAFRRFSADPGPTLLVLLGVVLLLGWVVRRSGWAQATPAPLVARRRPGQVVGAALRMLGRHRRVFLLVAAPAAAASVVSSVLSAATPPVSAWWWSALAAVALLVLVLALAWAQVASAQAAVLATVGVWALVLVPLLVTGVLSPVALALLVAWSLVLPVVQLEGLGGWRALRRSWRLVRPQLLTVLLVLAVSFALVSALGGVLAALTFVVSPAPYTVVSGIPHLVTTLVWPVTALLTTYAWANGRALEAGA
ncbi:hypothetical protein GCM10011376_07060 [Nocardioides flavus (ex Wang et al. 2016)]|uniref:DUF946 domain-containing protein n=1 Tax=Nocardioides flavus (ex Wang et al. 2016) TaxID=2058780 RepID=A0ABQ3HHA2_9ACTN|nr:hypothetical protein [Nocardioides flavus (ex Wang et al. 2016)]GHE16032.1 hypothetical protein GCM10011376_07060 [Nocardioides flavus (ex Wang et al. 2016)]